MKRKWKSYKGFLHIKCPHCGKEKSFFTKKELAKYHCFQCGHDVILEGKMKLLWVNCPCGNRQKYLTNAEEKMFDVECLDCGMPVAVEWNAKKELYHTIKEE